MPTNLIKNSPTPALDAAPPPQMMTPSHFGRTVWRRDITQILRQKGVSAPTAQEITRWLLLYCRYYRVPPDLALAVMAVESGFNRFAVSIAGAQGLMQIMPFWRKKIGDHQDNLFNIEVNIRYGCAILRHYLDRYPTMDRALAAYNGSIGSQRYIRKVRAAMQRFDAIPTLANLAE
ncbi:MAG: lytic transglycosylase domain-containing protein [Mariprofundales bacterium]|nr:lytic transglycosylase domain-containing protein [Mariprofundales bacterium]